jgi:hypothetical protein
MKLKAVHCLSCDDVVYSRAQHDFRRCSCGCVFVDGGFSYFKYGALPDMEFKVLEVEVNTPRDALYDDWNNMHDNYGILSASS